MTLLYDLRRAFFSQLSSQAGLQVMRSIVLTHALPDRPELLEAIDSIAAISLVIAIPYSIDQQALRQISSRYQVATPSLDDLLDSERLKETVRPYIKPHRTCVLEIGGYFAPLLVSLQQEFGESIVGFIEDTESGHRRYMDARPLPYPVYSVARSSLKRAEDALVGPSCVFSVERLLRAQGLLERPRRILVLGYGKVGRGAAHALADRGNSVCVYDSDPIQCALALAEGFQIPERDQAIRSSDLIFGCTGRTSINADDFPKLRSGSILVSCSSKSVEFELNALARDYIQVPIAANFDGWDRGNQRIYMLAQGTPVNFVDGAVIGPALSLVQGEILVALGELVRAKPTGDISEVSNEQRKSIASLWWQTFCDPVTGSYV